MNKKRGKIFNPCLMAAITGGLAVALLAGCGHPEPETAPPVESLWQASAVVADGKGEDWAQVPPLYYDKETRTSIWAANDGQRLCLLITVGNEETARQLERSGIVLSLKTQEEGADSFRLKLKGSGIGGPGGGPPPSPDAAGSENTQDRPEPPRVNAELPKKITVFYPYASDEMTMTLEEAASNGISLGLGHQGHGSWIFETVIHLDTIYFKTPVPDGSRVTLSLASLGGGRGQGGPDKGEKQGGSPGEPPGRGGGSPPAGGPPGGGGGHGSGPGNSGGFHKKDTAFNPSVTLILSSGPSAPKAL